MIHPRIMDDQHDLNQRARAEIEATAVDVTTPPMPSLSRFPTCPGCGMSVEREGATCGAPTCERYERVQAPKATIEVGRQPEPAYVEGGPDQVRG